MSLLYKNPEDIKYSVKIDALGDNVSISFYANCGKHGMEEPIDGYEMKVKEFLDRLQAPEEMFMDMELLVKCYVSHEDGLEMLKKYNDFNLDN